VSYVDRFRLLWTPYLRQSKGKTWQAIGLMCPRELGGGGELTLRVGNNKYTAEPADLITHPRQEGFCLWLVPRPQRSVRCKATWTTSLGNHYEDALTIKPADRRQVHVVFKTHLDVGYTQSAEQVIEQYTGPFLDKLLENLDATAGRKQGKRYVWTMPTWLLERCLDPQRVDAKRIKRLEHYCRNGQVVWGLMPFTTHSEFFGLEEMCRSLYAARHLAERFGQPVPSAAKMTDVPAHTASLGMAFAAAGGKFFQVGTNPNSVPPDVPSLFWWDLPDESRLLCHYHSDYGTPLVPPADWPWEHYLAIQMTTDNQGPTSLEPLADIDWIEANFDSPSFRIGRLEDFANAIIRQSGKELPELEEEFTDWWAYGIASQAGPTAMAREDKDRLPSLETLRSLGILNNGRSVSRNGTEQEEIEEAYRQLSLYTEHTWGDHAGDQENGFSGDKVYSSFNPEKLGNDTPMQRWANSWQQKAERAGEARKRIDRLETQAFNTFGSQVSKGRGRHQVVLFNTLSWPRGGLVRLSDQKIPRGEFELVDPTTGANVLYERGGGQIEFIAPKVPAGGYLALEIHPVGQRNRPGCFADWQAGKLTLHSNDSSMIFHTAGGLARWHDRQRSCQWCATDAEWPMGSYIYEMPGAERMKEFVRDVHTRMPQHVEGGFHRRHYENMAQFGPVGGGKARVKCELTPLCARVIVDAPCPPLRPPGRRSGNVRRYRTTFTRYRDRRELHVNLTLIGKRPTLAAEAGYACFPFSGESAFVIVDRIAQLVRPHEDLAERVNAAMMANHHGVRVENNLCGMNFYPLHTPLVSFVDPGVWRFDDDGDYEDNVLYATLFNNCWGTNFALWQGGDFSFDFVLQPTGNDDWDGGLAHGGAEFFRPLHAMVTDAAIDPPARSLLQVQPEKIQLVDVKAAGFEQGMVLRLWNADVERIDANLQLPIVQQGDTLWKCDLLERGKQKIKMNSRGEARVPFKPNEVATLLLKTSKNR